MQKNKSASNILKKIKHILLRQGLASQPSQKWKWIYKNPSHCDYAWDNSVPSEELGNILTNWHMNPSTAIDIGCGTGTNAIFIKKTTGACVVAVDLSENALKIAEQRASQENISMNFGVSDALALPFKNATFDFAFDRGCFHHIKPPDRMRYIHELTRILRKDSFFFLLCFSTDDKQLRGSRVQRIKRKIIGKTGGYYFSDSKISSLFSPSLDIIYIGREIIDFEKDRGRIFNTYLMKKRA